MSLTNQQQADEHFMRLALCEAQQALEEGDRPCSQPNRDFA